MIKLGLTSPHTKGKDVNALQFELHKKGYLQGAVDGEFGPDTARAVFRAKYWLGYRKPDQHASDLLFDYLRGNKKPTPAMRARVMNRKRIAQQTPIRLKMWKEANKWIGTKEVPFGSNRVKFSLWYGAIGPWCDMFVTWCGTAVGSKAFLRGKYYAYVPYTLSDAKAGRNNLTITYKPQTGDLALFDWDNDGVADHIEFFGGWLNQSEFGTIGGNTGHTNASNGGEVLPMRRSKSDVIAFVHVGR
jgi:peptidoglycan hydrolase-like protein with peptidoglycan-binding domain